MRILIDGIIILLNTPVSLSVVSFPGLYITLHEIRLSRVVCFGSLNASRSDVCHLQAEATYKLGPSTWFAGLYFLFRESGNAPDRVYTSTLAPTVKTM